MRYCKKQITYGKLSLPEEETKMPSQPVGGSDAIASISNSNNSISEVRKPSPTNTRGAQVNISIPENNAKKASMELHQKHDVASIRNSTNVTANLRKQPPMDTNKEIKNHSHQVLSLKRFLER